MNTHPDVSFQFLSFLFLTVRRGNNIDFESASEQIDTLVKKLADQATTLVNGSPRVHIFSGAKTHPIFDKKVGSLAGVSYQFLKMIST